MSSDFSIRLGESAASLLQRYPTGIKINRQPAGLDFYSKDWGRPPYGRVTVEHGRYSFSVPHATGIRTAEDQDELKAEGFAEYTVYALLSDSDKLLHQEARDRIYGLLKSLRDSGWQQLIERGDPRLQGKERLLYTLQTSNLNGLDADYLPTLTEWMQLQDRTPWRLYVDGVFLEMTFDRDPTLMDPEKHGAYLLTINLQTTNEYFRRFVEPKDRLKWQSLLPGVLKDVAIQRAQKETELKAKGVVIMESYIDPKPPK